MAVKPTPGGSDGTYGAELNAFLDVSMAADGKIINEALQTASTAPVADAALANKLYVDNQVLRKFAPVDTVSTEIFTKYFTGTLDADSSTSVAHGVASGRTKILSLIYTVTDDVTATNIVGDIKTGATAAQACEVRLDDASVIFSSVGANIQGNTYTIKIEYIA